MYKIYRSSEKAKAPEKLFMVVSLNPNDSKGMSDEQIAECLSLLSRDALDKGTLDKAGEDVFAMRKIQKALDGLFIEPPNALTRLVRSAIGDDSIKPAQVKTLISRIWAEKGKSGTILGSTTVSIPTGIGVNEYTSEKEHEGKHVSSPEGITHVDTIVVPAREDGFNETFLGENRWYAIRIHPTMIPRIKYIAAYQVAPVSAVTHLARVKDIQPWEDSGKYVVNFTEPAKEVKHITLLAHSNKAPLAPRYTSLAKLQSAKTLNDLF